MKELYDKVQESIKDSFKDFIPMGSEKEREMLKEREAKRLLRKRKATISEEQPSKKLKLRTETVDEIRNYLRIVDFEKRVHTLELEDGTMIHMLAERRYPLSRELMIRMLDHGMEVEDERFLGRQVILDLSKVQDYALWDVIKNGNSWVSVPQITQENGTLVTNMSILVTAEKKTNKKNDVKARSLLLMALPNAYQLTFSQYNDAKTMFAAIKTRFGGNEATKKTQKTLLKQQYENFSASSTKSLDSIFNRLQKIVSRLAILGVVIAQEDLNSKFLRSLPPEWNTHVHGLTNQIHEDDLEAMDLKWQLSLLSMRVKRYFQRTGKKIFINTNDTARYDKSKVEYFNYHKMGHFSRECRAPRHKEGQFRNQDNTRKHGNNEDTSSKTLRVNAIKTSACWVWRPTKPNGASLAFKRYNYIDARVRYSHLMDYKGFVAEWNAKSTDRKQVAYLLDYKEFDGVLKLILVVLNLIHVDPSVSTASSNDQDSPKICLKWELVIHLKLLMLSSSKDELEVDLGNIFNSYTVPTTIMEKTQYKIHKNHPIKNVIGDVKSSIQIRRMTKPTFEQGFLSAVYEQKTHDTLNTCLYACFLSQIEPTSIAKALSDSS
ncbi:hypothetical protein Tco_1122311 [Tanacetum coccineum]|uniref:Uncharacterized protein n=1 Tax=Tanacetum coccineum TaxID=301880 RepID=A0ABQ5J0N4_9ASTR